MTTITIQDLEVSYRVGVSEEERAHPQRLLVTVEMTADSASAERSDNLDDTIDYYELTQALLGFGESREWKLIEKLAANLADVIRERFSPDTVSVEVKKFVISQAAYVSVRITRP